MAVTWGSYNGHLRFGIDLTTTSPSASSTTVTVSVKLYIQVDDTWNFDDTQSWSLSGSHGSSGSFSNTLDNNASKLLYSTSFAAGIDYDGGPTYSYTASLSGAYNGADPTHSRSITLPRRPASAPSAPGTPTAGSITATSVSLTWTAGATNGAALTGNGGQVARDSAFASIVSSWSESGWSGQTVTGLTKGTTLYARVRAQNSVGWSAWSGSRAFTTLSTAASAPTMGAVSGFGPTSAVIAFAAPSDDGGETITGYELQRATDSSFTQGIDATFATKSPVTFSNLLPGTTYYVRARAITSYGAGTWSSAVSFKTLSAVRIGNGTSWVPALVWVGDGTKWAPATVKVGDGTSWK